ncbi:MAG: ROK family glucokinase [Eubacteriales bacterium]|jgi:glucokinase
MKTYAFGVDVGGTTVKIGLFNVAGDLLEKWEIPTVKDRNGAQILPDIAASILKKLDDRDIEKDDVAGVGIGVPGAVLRESIVNRCVNVGWGIRDVAAELSEALGGLPVKVGNDANVAALGEMWKGGGKGHRNIVMVTLGTGVGGGIIINGRIVSGNFGAGGEIGHMCVNHAETERCNCGRRGCLEQYASATGISRLAKAYLKAHPDEETPLRKKENPSARDVFDAYRDGDAVATAIAEQVGDYLGRGLANVADVVDPEAFVIGGGVSKAGKILIDLIRKYYQQYVFHTSTETEIALAELGNDAGIYGSVRMILGD